MESSVWNIVVGLVVFFVAAASGAGAQSPKTPTTAPVVTDVELPGGIERLLNLAGVPGLTDPAVAIPAFIRAVHILPQKTRTDIPAMFRLVSAGAKGTTTAADRIPLPLTADWWSSNVLRQRQQPNGLAAAILTNRRAAFIYLGLASLDDETLAYFSAHPASITAMNDRAAGTFGQWGRSVHIEQGRVQVPGGDGASAIWQEVVGEAPTDPDRFFHALMSRDGGRLACFYDAVTHLDRDRQAFALAAGQGANRVGRVKDLYSSVASTGTILTDGDWPVVRHPFGPAAVLRQVRVDDGGRMKGPAGEAFWEAAIHEDASRCPKAGAAGAPADAAWLVERVERQPLELRGHWVAAIAFAQRVFGAAGAKELPSACEAVNAFPHSDGLLLSLERAGFTSPADYAAMLEFSRRLWAGVDRKAAVIRTAQVEGIVQVLQEAVAVRALPRDRAREMLLSMAKLPSDSGPDSILSPGVFGRWMRRTLLPGVCPEAGAADACLLHLASGDGATGGITKPVEWEEDRYRVDLGAATAVRLERVRRVQRATRIEDALNLVAAAGLLQGARAGAAELERAAVIVKAVSPALTLNGQPLFGHGATPVQQMLDRVLEGLDAKSTEKTRAEAAAVLQDVADVALADALVSFAYAMAIGEPDDAALMAGNPARGHLFDSTIGPATEPWHLPEEVQALDRSWLVEGSILHLRTVYSKSWLRRLSIHDPGEAVRPDPQDVRVFGETVKAFTPFNLTDAGRDAIVAAIRRGRSRVAALIGSPAEFWKAAREAGLGEWRCRAALWAASRPVDARGPVAPGPAGYFSLAELMWLGVPDAPAEVIDAWGVATRPIDGALSVRMPRATTWEDYEGPRGVGQLATQMADVHLAVAEVLADMKLPAVLAPDIAAQAGWDVMTAARMAHRNDWYALVRAAQAIPRDRFLDYISALTAIGPLVPLTGR